MAYIERSATHVCQCGLLISLSSSLELNSAHSFSLSAILIKLSKSALLGKLACLSLATFFQTCLKFSRCYSRICRPVPLNRTLALLINIRLGWRNFFANFKNLSLTFTFDARTLENSPPSKTLALPINIRLG
jgi:hypothetical protein